MKSLCGRSEFCGPSFTPLLAPMAVSMFKQSLVFKITASGIENAPGRLLTNAGHEILATKAAGRVERPGTWSRGDQAAMRPPFQSGFFRHQNRKTAKHLPAHLRMRSAWSTWQCWEISLHHVPRIAKTRPCQGERSIKIATVVLLPQWLNFKLFLGWFSH